LVPDSASAGGHLEISNQAQVDMIDRVDAGRRAGGHLLVDFELADAAAIIGKMVDAGAQLDAAPTRTPFRVSPASSPSGLHDHRVPGAGRPAMIA
jgi:hypothetical protein